MSGTLTQLAAVGAQDADTIVNPQRTFWKSKHARHTAFAMEPKVFTFTGSFDYNRKTTAIIPRSGDLLAKLWLQLTLAALDTVSSTLVGMFTDDVGRAILNEVSLEVGSVIYDRLKPEFMHVWEELTILEENHLGQVTGKSESDAQRAQWATLTQLLYVPLEFWFQREYGAALPLVALHLTDIKVNVTTNPKSMVIQTAPTSTGTYTGYATSDGAISNMQLMGEFVYLDDPEREYFASSSHKYLITINQQVTATVSAAATTSKHELTFNHPTKEIIWVARTATNTSANQWFNFEGQETGQYGAANWGGVAHSFLTARILLNSNERVTYFDPIYYNIIQCQQHHTRIPRKRVYVYSLALAPEQPGSSGEINLSRIEKTHVEKTYTALSVAQDEIYMARSFNLVTVGSGVALLRWAS